MTGPADPTRPGERRLRVAYMPDSFHEVNGVAHTSRHFVAFARRHDLPFLAIHAGPKHSTYQQGSVTHLQLFRGWGKFRLDKDLWFDLLLGRYYKDAERAVREFGPDVIHITGPSDIGIMGAVLAWRLKLPLAASWHTNVHEYAGRRARTLLNWAGREFASRSEKAIESASLNATARFYRLARVLYAPNQELIELLQRVTHRPCFLMARGVDTELFSPVFRDTSSGGSGRPLTIGYVGRLTVEKNIHLLAEIERALVAAGIGNFRIYVVGQGAEEGWLRENLKHLELAGVLKGRDLSRAYANMDIFVFPSQTDTFGNVVLEALSSGVPAVVTNGGGPKFIVRNKETGYVAASNAEFLSYVQRLAADHQLRLSMGRAARAFAEASSWDSVFNAVYSGYSGALQSEGRQRRGAAGQPPDGL